MPVTPDLNSLRNFLDINIDLLKAKKEFVDDQSLFLSSFFEKYKPKGAFVYISIGDHTKIFDLPQIYERDAYAIDPFTGYNEETVLKIQSKIEINPKHKLLKIKDVEAVDNLKNVKVGTVYMLNSYGDAINAVKMLDSNGYLVCNNYTGSVNEARNINELKLVGVLANNSTIVDEENLNLYFEKIDSFAQFVAIYSKNKASMSYILNNIIAVLNLHKTIPENEVLQIWFDLINLYNTCPILTKNIETIDNISGDVRQDSITTIGSKNLSKIKQFLAFSDFRDNIIDMDSNLMLGNTLIPTHFTKKNYSSNDLFIFRKI